MPSSAAQAARFIDHTLLKPGVCAGAVEKVCAEAIRWKFRTICIPPCHVSRAETLLFGSGVSVITVVGFPLGYATSAAKAFEAADAVSNGAKEVDMVLNICHLRAGNYGDAESDVRQVVEAVSGYPVKVILETASLSEDEIVIGCRVAQNAGASYVKTSTGLTGGATVEHVRLMRETVGTRFGIKASGGIRDADMMMQLIQAGANRIGTSESIAIMEEFRGGYTFGEGR
ncbi:MAG: deoxyribose-phosphate aldolase [Desulfovibrio sp.]